MSKVLPLANNMNILLAAVLCAPFTIVMAAGLDDSRELTKPSLLPENPTAGFSLPPVDLPSAPASSAKVSKTHVEKIIILGNKSIPTDQLEKITAPYIGKDLTEAEVEELRIQLTRQYVDRGYINSGALLEPETTSEPGLLTFKVIEGHLKEIQITGLDRLKESYVAGRLQKDSEETLNVEVLRERFQLLLDDPLFSQINSRIIPGQQTGEAILALEVERARPYRFGISIDNYRPPSIGERGYSLNGEVRNLTGWGDVLNGEYGGAVGEGSGNSYSLSWRVPLNRYPTELSVNFSHGRSVVVEAPLTSLNIQSEIERREIGISHSFYHTLRSHLSMGLSYAKEKNTTTIDGLPFSFLSGAQHGETRSSLEKFWQEFSTKSESSYLGLRSTFSRADLNGSGGSGKGTPDNNYLFWLGQAQYLKKLTDGGTQLVGRGTLQATDSRMSNLHELAIGGANTVRGFRENQLVRANGYILNLELSTPLPISNHALPRFSMGVFYDQGGGKSKGESTTTISSYGLTLNATWKGFRGNLALAKPLSYPSAFDKQRGTLQDDGIHFQLGYDF